MFPEESKVVRIPKSAEPEDRRFAVAIRYAAEMTGFHHDSLISTLRKLCNTEGELAHTRAPRWLIVGAFGHAWAVIDSVNRLRRLLWKAPGLADEKFAQDFVKHAMPLRGVRDFMQHPEGDLTDSKIPESMLHVFGVLIWHDLRKYDSHENPMTLTFLLNFLGSGPQAKDEKLSDIPANLMGFTADFGPVRLVASGHDINLTEFDTEVDELTYQLSDYYEKKWGGHGGELFDADTFVSMHAAVDLTGTPGLDGGTKQLPVGHRPMAEDYEALLPAHQQVAKRQGATASRQTFTVGEGRTMRLTPLNQKGLKRET